MPQIRIIEIRIRQVGIVKPGKIRDGTGEGGPRQVRVLHFRMRQIRIAQIGIPQVGIVALGKSHVGVGEVGPRQVRAG